MLSTNLTKLSVFHLLRNGDIFHLRIAGSLAQKLYSIDPIPITLTYLSKLELMSNNMETDENYQPE